MPRQLRDAPKWATKPPFGVEVDPSHPRAQGLFVALPLNENAGTPRHGYGRALPYPLGFTSSPTWGLRTPGPGLVVSGGSALTIAGALGFDYTQADFSGRCIVYVNSWSSFATLWDKGTLGRQCSIFFNTSGDINFLGINENGADPAISTGMTAGKVWDFFFTRDLASGKFIAYVNGVAKGSATKTGTNSAAERQSWGANPTGGGASFDGTYFLIEVWTRALSASEVAEEYLNPWGKYRPQTPRRGYRGGAATTFPVTVTGSVSPSGLSTHLLKSGVIRTGSITPTGALVNIKSGGQAGSIAPAGELINLKVAGMVITGAIGGDAGAGSGGGFCINGNQYPDRAYAFEFDDARAVGKPVPELCILVRHLPQVYQNFRPVPELCSQETCPAPIFQTLCEEFAYLLTDVFNIDPATGQPMLDPITGEPIVVDQAVLPIVYGDFGVGGLRGPIPAVLIDPVKIYYAAAAHPVESIDEVYIGDVLQTTGYEVFPNAKTSGFDCPIAFIRFDERPTEPVSWRGRGKFDDDGLIVNPIVQLEDLLTEYAGFTPAEFELASLAWAKADTAGYETAWVVNDRRTVQDWVTEMLFNVMGFWRVNRLGQLDLHVDTGASPRESDVIADIVAARDCIDGDDGVEFVADRRNLVNAMSIYYRAQWADEDSGPDKASELDEDQRDAASVFAYGEVQKSAVLRGLRRQADVVAWAAILFKRQSFLTRVEGAQVHFVVKGGRLAHGAVGDIVGFTWPYGPVREDSNLYVNEMLRIVAIAHEQVRDGASEVTAVDLGAYRARSDFDAEADFDAALAFGGERVTT